MNLTAAQKVKLISMLLLIADTVLVYGDKVSVIPGLPFWVAHCWPFIIIVAGVIHQSASIFGVKAPPVYKPTEGE